MNSRETGKGKFGMRRTAMALAVASAFGLGTDAAFAAIPTITAAKIQANGGAETTHKIALTFSEAVLGSGGSGALAVADFTLAGTGLGGLSISSVEYVAGTTAAILTLSGTIPDVSGGNTGVLTVDGAVTITDTAGTPAAFAPGTATDLNAATTDAVAPTLNATFTVNNSVQPNTVTLTFDEPLGNKAAAETQSNWTVNNNDGTIAYSCTSAALSADRLTLTLTMVAVAPETAGSFITNAAVDAHIKVNTHPTAVTDLVGNPLGSVTIVESGGTLTKDTTAPTVTATLAKTSATTMTLSFSEKVDAASAVVLTNYALTGTGGLTGNPSAVVLQANGTDVLLTVPTTAGFATGQTLIVTATGVTDVAGVTIVGTNVATYTAGPLLAYSATTFAEAGGNAGAIGNTATITLTGDTFTGSNDDDWSAAVTNTPAGLAASLIRTSATVLTLSFSGNATAHANAQDISNLTVTLADGKFTGGSAAAVGNATKADLVVDFVDSDIIAPTVTTYSPADDATGVSTTGTLALTFSENVTAVSGKNIYIKSGGATVETIAANDTTKVSGGKGGPVYINPTTVLTASTAYNVEIDAGAFVDTNAPLPPNAYAGITNATTWNFETGVADIVAPTVSSVVPLDNAVDINPAGDLTITFSEYIQAGAGNIVIKTTAGDTVIETIAAADTSKVSISKPTTGGSKATINPTATLALNTEYYVAIDATAFKDKANNAYAGMAATTTWSFTTKATDTFAPVIRSVTLGTPTSSGVSASGTVNEAATVYYVITPCNPNCNWPTAAEVAAGTVSGGAAATAAGSVAMTAEIATAINVTGLAPSTDYGVFYTAKDSANNLTTYPGTVNAYYDSFTTAAAPAPAAPSGDSGTYTPPAPTTTTVTPGGTATVGATATPVNAGAGSTLNVTSGTSGATINLPTPTTTGTTTTGTTATDAVNVAIGGNTLSVKPTESGSVVKTATVSIGGKDTTVLNVTVGTAQVSASTANQPLVSVGTGANAVVISSGSASATVITSVDKTTGVTSLTLPKSTTSNDADASVNITIGGQAVNVQPSGGGDVVVTLKTVTVNGVSTQVVSVTGGSATVTSSQPNQPLLAVGGGSGSNAIVVTADTAGTAATSTVNVGTGETFIAVSSGVVTLPTNAFAAAGTTNGFAAIKDGKIYAGEIAVLNSAGKITGVRLGSQSSTAANVGDAVKMTGAAGLTMSMAVPNLKGKVARVSDSQDFGDVIAASLGAGYISNGQNSNGVLSLTTPAGGVINALPAGDITVDTSRADGVTVSGNGRKEVVKSGVIVNLAPAVSDIAQLVGQVVALDKNASVTVNDYGVLQTSINGITYGVQPAWAVSKASGGSVGFTTDAEGQVVYQDGAGNQQTLYPVFIDLGQVVAAFKPMDAYARATGNADGTITAKLLNKTYTLIPDYVLIAVPAEHAKDVWWLDNGKVFVKNSDDKTAQGFNVK